jgi:hypothetical protein
MLVGIAGSLFRFGQPAPARDERSAAERGEIAFVRGGDVYTCTPGGRITTRLTSDGRNSFPIWSPSGRYIAYSKAEKRTSRGGHEHFAASLWVVTADGRYSKLVAKAESFDAIYPAAWLPNSKGVVAAVHRLESEPPATIRVFTLDGRPYPRYGKWIRAGRKARFLRHGSEAQSAGFACGQAAAFAPGGGSMILTAGTEVFGHSVRLDMYRMNADGSRINRLTTLPHVWINCLRWHPSAARLLSAEERYLPGKPEEAGIWIRDTHGRALGKVAGMPTASFSGMDWSPRGDRIVLQMPDPDYARFDNRFEHPVHFGSLSSHSSIWIMNADGTGKRKILDNACHPNWRRVPGRQ